MGDFVIRQSERGGYTLICKIGPEKLSFPHLLVADDGNFSVGQPNDRLLPRPGLHLAQQHA